mmetsp:Transcript_142977/g.456873  ORF Transcript_142977/g.456873 Transcript_142977/m.456873 type:complete len:100 (+) Transcript_142977:86-385(+)
MLRQDRALARTGTRARASTRASTPETKPRPRAAQNSMKTLRGFPKIWFFSTLSTLKRTVFESGLHWPTVTMSPSLGSKAGEQWAAMLEWRFSKRLNFLM